MEIQVNKLREILDLLKPVVHRKTSVAAFNHVLATDGKIIAGDGESTVVAALPEAGDAMVLPFAPVLELLKRVPGYELLKVEMKDGRLGLSWSAGSAAYDTLKPEDFPPVPQLEVEAESQMDGDSLIGAMMSVLPYVATETTRPVLQAVAVVLGNPIEVAAADGFRLAFHVLPLQFPLERTIIVPSAAVSLLGHLLSKSPRTPTMAFDTLIPAITAKRQIDVALGKNRLQVNFQPAVSVIINLIDGQFPDYLRLIPKEEPALKARLYGPEFEAAVRRVAAVAREGSGAIRLVFEDSTMTVSAIAEGAQVEAKISTMTTQGAPNRIAIDQKYLLDYLKGKDGVITLSMTAPTAPIIFEHQQAPKVLLMPMQVEWPGDPKPEPEPKEPEDIKEAVETEKSPEPPEDEELTQPEAEASATEPTPPKTKRNSRRKSTEPAG